MDADLVQGCLEAGGCLHYPSSPSSPTSTFAATSSSSSILQSLPLTCAALRRRWPRCVVIVSMEDYRTTAGGDDGSDVDAIDFDALARNLQR
uniref:Uncharacterized protein n=1 Tax=Oryza brachyantha TaxID=4533 RepID=J3N1P4_ORYBR